MKKYSGIENIYLNRRMMGYSRKEMDERLNGIVEFADIGDFINQPVKLTQAVCLHVWLSQLRLMWNQIFLL